MRRDLSTVLFVVVAAVIAVLMARLDPRPQQTSPQYRVTFAVSPLIASAPVYVAKQHGFFDEEGVAVEIRTFPTGRDCLNDLNAKRAQYATAGDMPATVEGISGTDTAIIATIATTDRDVRIIARRDRGISHPVNLRGKLVAIAAREDGEYFLDALLGMNGLSSGEVKTTALKAGDAKAALVDGTIDAAVMSNPDAKLTEGALGKNAIIFTGEGIYTMFWNVLTSREIIRRTPDLDRKMLRALAKAVEYTAQHPAEARNITAERIGVPSDVVAAEWDKYLFHLALDQALLAVLTDQARWAARRGLVPPNANPNFLYFVSTEGLAAVRPQNVTIIR